MENGKLIQEKMSNLQTEINGLNKKITEQENKIHDFESNYTDGDHEDKLVHNLQREEFEIFKNAAAASITGDTVGDPMKDTSGPSLNILIKLSSIISLVFGSFFVKTSYFVVSSY